MTIDEAKRLLNDAGYLCVKWNPGAAWAIGHTDEIGAAGITVELTQDECRSAGRQMNTIWERASKDEPALSPTR